MFAIDRLLEDVDVRPFNMALFVISTSVLIIGLVKSRFQHCSKLRSNFFVLNLSCQCFMVLRESNYGSCCL